jgi:hypothetical protein
VFDLAPQVVAAFDANAVPESGQLHTQHSPHAPATHAYPGELRDEDQDERDEMNEPSLGKTGWEPLGEEVAKVLAESKAKANDEEKTKKQAASAICFLPGRALFAGGLELEQFGKHSQRLKGP